MKTNHLPFSALTAAALVAGATFAAHAQGWETVDDFQYGVGLNAAGSDIGTDSSGTILYAVGGADTDASGARRLAVVNFSHDQGKSWDTLPSPAEPLYDWEHNRAFASADGRLFIGGNGQNANLPANSVSWFIRESSDGGETWETTDSLSGEVSGCAEIAIHPVTGDVYAGGSSATQGRIIRKRPVGMAQFSSVYEAGPGDIGSAWAIAFEPTEGMVIAAGDQVDAATKVMTWVVQRSPTGERGTWETVDTFKTKEWTGISARGCLVTANGTIYVSGVALNSKTRKSCWVVRVSTDGGNTWSLSDNFSYGGSVPYVFEMAQDAAGALYVCGWAADKDGKLFWIVRRGAWTTTIVRGKPVSSFAWTTSDAYQLSPGKPAMPIGITVDAAGNVFVCGRAQDANGIERFIVRTLPVGQ